MSGIYLSINQSIKSDSNTYYRILEFLGNGANAYAYRCFCTSGTNKGLEFVLKLQYNLSTETRRERFKREAAFLQSNVHPSILQQYDMGTFVTNKNAFPFIITGYMPKTLAKELQEKGIPFRTKVKYACQLLSAIAFLQNLSIVHRDIKPNNIFINNDNAILGDFGLIKKVDNVSDGDDIELIKDTILKPSFGYAAMARYYRTPELVNYANSTDNIYIESDVFQLGLVLAELFSGKNPLLPSEDLRSPIQLETIAHINAPKVYVKRIRNVLEQMLIVDRKERITADLALDHFSGIFQEL